MTVKDSPSVESSRGLRQAVVIGAGFSGLTLAYYLNSRGVSVEVFEKDRKSGGLIQTKKLRHGIAESAANAFLSTVELEKLCETIGVPLSPVLGAARKRFIWRAGKPKQWPLNWWETIVLFLKILVLPFRERPYPLETVRAWGHRVLGKKATQYLLLAGLQGIYAGDPDKMSARLIISRIWQSIKKRRAEPKSHYKGSVAPLDGMSSFHVKLTDYLLRNGVKIHFNAELDGLSFKALYDQKSQEGTRFFICTPPEETSLLLSKMDPKLSALLNQVEMIPVLSATMIYKKEDQHSVAVPGFGCLFPQGDGFRVLGILMNSFIFPNRSAEHSETWIFRDNFDNETEALDCIRVERKKIYGREDLPLEFKVTRWPKGIPHYSIELEALLEKRIFDNVQAMSIYVHGNYLGDLGLTKILERSKNLAFNVMG